MCFPAMVVPAVEAANVAMAGMSAMQVASMGLSVASTFAQMHSQNQQAKYNAAVQRNNAIASTYQAQSAIEAGMEEERKSRLQTRQLAGQQRASLAANGIQLGSGSAVDVLSDTAQQGELDAQTVAHNAQLEAWGFRNQASNYEAQARGTLAAGRSNMIGSLLSGATTVADKWYKATA